VDVVDKAAPSAVGKAMSPAAKPAPPSSAKPAPPLSAKPAVPSTTQPTASSNAKAGAKLPLPAGKPPPPTGVPPASAVKAGGPLSSMMVGLKMSHLLVDAPRISLGIDDNGIELQHMDAKDDGIQGEVASNPFLLSPTAEDRLRKRRLVEAEAEAHRTVAVEMCEECEKRIAYVVCRDAACDDKLYCVECNQTCHTGATGLHVRAQYVPAVRSQTLSSSSSIGQHEVNRMRTNNAVEQFNLLKLNTRRAKFVNPLMEEWSRIKKSCWARFQFNTHNFFVNLFTARKNSFPFWNQTIKEIEANRGSSIATYFDFLKWIFIVNFMLSLLAAILIVPRLTVSNFSNITNWMGMLQGTGLEQTSYFYQGYNATMILSTKVVYQFDIAWIMVCSAMLFVSLVAIAIHIDATSPVAAEEGSDESVPFSKVVFGAFNWRLTDSNAMDLQRRWMATNLKSLVAQESEKDEYIKAKNWVTTVKRTWGILFSLALLAAVITFISLLIIYQSNANLQKYFLKYFGDASVFFVPACISILSAITPKVISWIVEFEGHKSASAFKHLFARIFILRMFFVLVVMYQTYQTATEDNAVSCEETAVGVVFYQLVIFDFIIECITSTIVPFLSIRVKRCFYKCDSSHAKLAEDQDVELLAQENPHADIDKVKGMLDHQIKLERDQFKGEFNVSFALLDLIYRQALIWSGLCFCPMLPVVGALFSFLQVFFKNLEVRHLTRLPDKPFGIAKQASFFRAMVLVTLGISFLPYTYFLTGGALKHSNCGPYRGTSAYQRIVDVMKTLPTWCVSAFGYMSNVLLLWLIIVLLALAWFISMRRLRISQEEFHHCEARLKMERQEKTAIIRTHGIVFDEAEKAGREMFNTFMLDEMGAMGEKYGALLLSQGYGDINILLKLSEADLTELLTKKYALYYLCVYNLSIACSIPSFKRRI
jgi:hypothetical protein